MVASASRRDPWSSGATNGGVYRTVCTQWNVWRPLKSWSVLQGWLRVYVSFQGGDKAAKKQRTKQGQRHAKDLCVAASEHRVTAARGRADNLGVKELGLRTPRIEVS